MVIVLEYLLYNVGLGVWDMLSHLSCILCIFTQLTILLSGYLTIFLSGYLTILLSSCPTPKGSTQREALATRSVEKNIEPIFSIVTPPILVPK